MGARRRGPISNCRPPKDLPGFLLWKGLKSIGHGDVVLRPGREGDDRDPLLHQQPGSGREAVRPRGSGPLGHREWLSLESWT